MKKFILYSTFAALHYKNQNLKTHFVGICFFERILFFPAVKCERKMTTKSVDIGEFVQYSQKPCKTYLQNGLL